MAQGADDRDRIARELLEQLEAEKRAQELANDVPRNAKGSDNTERLMQDLQNRLNDPNRPG